MSCVSGAEEGSRSGADEELEVREDQGREQAVPAGDGAGGRVAEG